METDYNGPRAGKSSNEEWLAVRDYQAFLWIKDGTWNYSDFDCWVYALAELHRQAGIADSKEKNV